MLITAGFSYHTAALLSVIMKSVSVLCFLASAVIVDKAGRRVIILIGFFGSFVAWALMGTFEWTVIKGILYYALSLRFVAL